MQVGQANKDHVSYFHPFINPFFLTLSPALRVAEGQESIPTNLCIWKNFDAQDFVNAVNENWMVI